MNTETTQQSTSVNDPMTDIEPTFHGVVAKHGRELFKMSIAVNMGQQAALKLLSLPEVNSSPHARTAVQILVDQFNYMGTAYAAEKKWTAEQLMACVRDCELAYASRIILPAERIVRVN